MSQTYDLFGLPFGSRGGQSFLSLQLADRVSRPEPLRQHMDDRGIGGIDSIAQGPKSTPPSGERLRDLMMRYPRGRGGPKRSFWLAHGPPAEELVEPTDCLKGSERPRECG
jgi:hypothetical protein